MQCVTETNKCKKINHKITGKSVLFVTSIPFILRIIWS